MWGQPFRDRNPMRTQVDCRMDRLPPPLAFLFLLFSGWINRQQQDVIEYCWRRIGSSARRTALDAFASPMTSGVASP